MQGRKKMFLHYDDRTDFFHSILRSLNRFSTVYLSVEEVNINYKELGVPLIADQFKDAGPLGGILSGLLSCEEEGLFVVPCDIPVIEDQVITDMLKLYDGTTPVIVKQGSSYYPMPGIYTKSQIPIMKEMLTRKDYKLMNAFIKYSEGTPVHAIVNSSGQGTVRSINTPEEYQRWRKRQDVQCMKNDREKISLEEATAIVTSHVSEVTVQEEVLLPNALGRCVAQDLYARVSQPPFPKSPLDGYAVRAEDTKGASKNSPVCLNVVDKINAGEVSKYKVRQMETVRVMTGAPVPEGADTVIRQEDVRCQDGIVSILAQAKPYENYCHMGEDFQVGACLIKAGDRMDAVRIGIAASMGYSRIPVKKILRAAVLVTGSELQEPGSCLGPGEIYDSNLYVISSRLRELGVIPVSMQKVRDEKESLTQAVAEGIEAADFLITTGGVSVGEKDLMPKVMEDLGAEILFHGVSVKPGTPVLAALVQEKIVLCLSGNPFGALVHLELLARPMLAEMAGDTGFLLTEKQGEMTCGFPKISAGRRMIRAIYEDGYVTLPEGLHASGVLGSMIGCNCLIDIEAGNKGLNRGDIVCVKML